MVIRGNERAGTDNQIVNKGLPDRIIRGNEVHMLGEDSNDTSSSMYHTRGSLLYINKVLYMSYVSHILFVCRKVSSICLCRPWASLFIGVSR